MSRALAERLVALTFLCACVAYGVAARDIPLLFGAEFSPFNARTFPQVLAWVGGAVALLLAVLPVAERGAAAPAFAGLNWRPALLLCVLVLLYAALIGRIGFFFASAAFLAAAAFVLGERDWRTLAAVSLGTALGLFVILDVLLGIYLDDPVLRALGYR